LGLPDECSPEVQTIQERRLAAHSRLIALGQQNPAYYIELATAYGWTVTITEYSAFICGEHAMGAGCGDSDNFFYWKVTITIGGGSIVYFICGGSECGDYLSFLGNVDDVLCFFNRYKPAHTKILWGFDGPEYSIEFSSAFDAIPSTMLSYLEGAFAQAFGLGFDVNLGGSFETGAFSDEFKKSAYFGYDIPLIAESLEGAFTNEFGNGFDISRGGDFSTAFDNGFKKDIIFYPWIFGNGFDLSFDTFYSENY